MAVAQEQHPDRTRLYAQWKNLNWPIAYDPLNQLALRAVPMGIAIDEKGNVVSRRVNGRFLSRWLDSDTSNKDKPSATRKEGSQKPLADPLMVADSFQFRNHWKKVAPGADWKNPENQISDAISQYKKLAQKNPKDARLQFRLGVAYRMRYDLAKVKTKSDFDLAVNHWTKALSLDPNHYIFRRRIQQYGPRLDKPYPFYDWVPAAIADIKKRGEKPVQLVARLTGSEIARPSRSIKIQGSQSKEPDPENKINPVESGELSVNAIVVPSFVRPGKSVRVHLKLSPTESLVKWNDEAGPSTAWLKPSEEFQLSSSYHSILPKALVHNQQKVVEFEVQVPRGYSEKTITINGYALVHLCRKSDGVCYYKRKDFSVNIPVKKK